MELPDDRHNLVALLAQLKDQRDWQTEVANLSNLIDALNDLGKSTSVRELSKVLHKSKSWVGVGIILVRGLKLYPEVSKCRNRNEAYLFLLKKNKLRRFLES